MNLQDLNGFQVQKDTTTSAGNFDMTRAIELYPFIPL